MKMQLRKPKASEIMSAKPSLGALLKKIRLQRGFSLREVALKAGISATYLSLLERDRACDPSVEKLEALAKALGEPHVEMFFAKSGRLHPRLLRNLMRHPSEWVGLLKAGENASSAQLRGLQALVGGATGISRTLALLDTIQTVENKQGVEKPLSVVTKILTEKPALPPDVGPGHLPPSVRSAITAIKAASVTAKDGANQDCTAPDKGLVVVHELGHARDLATDKNLPAATKGPEYGFWLIVHVAKGPSVPFKAVKQIMDAELGSDSKTILIDRPETIKQLKKILDDVVT